jgi:hypothetical protein
MKPGQKLLQVLETLTIGKLVDFNNVEDQLFQFDFTENNNSLSAEIINDTSIFSDWINTVISSHNCRYGIGGYNEYRTIYSHNEHFNASEEPRRLHLGVDIWGAAGTIVYCPIDATVHSFKFNNISGDYGATIILQHTIQGITFHSLYVDIPLQTTPPFRSIVHHQFRDKLHQ